MSSKSRTSPKRGDHIRVRRLAGAYDHHGIYVGGGAVIHYSGEIKNPSHAVVRRDHIETFAAGSDIEVVRYAQCLDAEETISRAESRLNERAYGAAQNNCEHFARWCRTGDHLSEQVVNGAANLGYAGAFAGAKPATAAVLSGLGAVGGLSGAGMMSGLAAAGSMVGGGAVAGLGVLATVPAVGSVSAVDSMLRDDAALPAQERSARQAGRAASRAGVIVGGAGAVAAVSSSGAVAGLSAAGVTSGLGAIGASVGGGMLTGATLAIAAPATAAAGLGYAAYRLWRWLA